MGSDFAFSVPEGMQNRSNFLTTADNLMVAKYRMPKLIEKYYLVWINGPTLLEHPLCRDRFLRFVKACIRYSRQELHEGWLRYFLERDLPKRYTNAQYREELITELVILFQHILDFNKVSFPDPVLEMRNPYSVKMVLGRYYYTDKDGNRRRVYSENKIEKILTDNFGLSWEEDYRRKYGLL